MKNNSEVEKYLKQALVNEELVLILKQTCSKRRVHYKWMFVVLFYSALHYFNAFLSNKGEAIPKKHEGADGGIQKAMDTFITNKNGIMDSAGSDYKQLFQWGYNVRYMPDRAELIKESDLEIAASCLNGVKLVTFNELGIIPKVSKSGKILNIDKNCTDYLKDLYDKRKP